MDSSSTASTLPEADDQTDSHTDSDTAPTKDPPTDVSTASSHNGPSPTDDVAADTTSVLQPLLDELGELDEAEQETLIDFLNRGARDREKQGPVNELSLITNALKTQPETDDWRAYVKAKDRVGPDMQKDYPDRKRTPLPQEMVEVNASLPAVMQNRSSGRNYSGAPLSLEALSTLLFLSYGVRDISAAYNRADVPLRTVPTTGGLQCIELYFVVNAVDGLEQGLYHYHAVDHAVELVERGSMRWKVVEACQDQDWVANASVVVFLAPMLSRIKWKYGRRAYRMTHVDGGIVGHNLHLSASSMGLSSCLITGFLDVETNKFLGLDGRDEYAVLSVSVGHSL
jgi:SagB-type dehydrogenase family enzyme